MRLGFRLLIEILWNHISVSLQISFFRDKLRLLTLEHHIKQHEYSNHQQYHDQTYCQKCKNILEHCSTDDNEDEADDETDSDNFSSLSISSSSSNFPKSTSRSDSLQSHQQPPTVKLKKTKSKLTETDLENIIKSYKCEEKIV